MHHPLRIALVLLFCSALPDAVALEVGVVEHHQVHGESLENNVTGEETHRNVAIYLPPGYAESPGHRYPVVYLLHGILDTEVVWTRAWYEPDDPFGTVARLMDRGIAAGRLQPMIVVMPDMRTVGGGSFYVDSAATGSWETFTVRDLVDWVDGRYRTLDDRESRGIAGHSMGGYGAIVMGMKYPELYSVVYGMNPALLGWAADVSTENPAFRSVLDHSDYSTMDEFYEPALITVAQAFSPNPERAPFFADLPFKVEGDSLVPDEPAFSKWEARFPANMAEQYKDNLKQLAGLRFDSGYEDQFTHIPIASREFSQRLTELEVPHIFEEYNGDHRNRLWGRTGRLYTEILPWFSLLLAGDAGGKH
jgi:S-formylglutathione hydrolase FrmB